MVHNCAILSCPLHNRRNIRKGLLFHSFPVDQHRFELWRQIVFNHCSQTLSINKHSKICYRHFHSDDYIANHTGLTRYLKATAIPSIFNETAMNNQLLTPPPTTTTITDTKTKRLLSTIDKLHQIQNATKGGMSQKLPLENDQEQPTPNDNNPSLDNSFTIDHQNTSIEQQSIGSIIY